MTNQFALPQTFNLKPHLLIMISLWNQNDNFEVQIKSYECPIPNIFFELLSLCDIKEERDHKVVNGLINGRKYNLKIGNFCSAFESMCGENITNTNIRHSQKFYNYEPITELNKFACDCTQEDRITIRFKESSLKIYVTGQFIPEEITEIQRGFLKANLDLKPKSQNSQIFEVNFNENLDKTKSLYVTLLEYFGNCGYKIIDSDNNKFEIELSKVQSKVDIISIAKYCEFIETISFEPEPRIVTLY
jgi:hypothetical protein